MAGIIQTFGKFRLLTFDHDPVTRGPTIEVAHEALLREWPRLREWLQESRTDIRMQRTLGSLAADWLKAGQDPSFLLRGARLDQFTGWTQTTPLALTIEERAFLNASTAETRAREAAEAERQAREQALEQRSRRFLRALVGVFAAAAVIAVFLSIFAFNQQGLAQSESQSRATQQAIAEEQADIAAANAEEALAEAEARATQQAIAEEQQAVAEHEAEARATAQANAEAQEHAALLQASIGLASQAILELEGNSPERAVPLALAALESYPYTWQAERALSRAVLGSRKIMTLPTNGGVAHAQLSADGSRILLGLEEGMIWVFNTFTGEKLMELSENEPIVASWSPDEESILTLTNWVTSTENITGTYYVQVWNADGGLRFQQPMVDWCLTSGNWFPWSPQGDRFVTANCDGTASVWDAETGEIVLTLSGHEPGFMNAAWSPQGDWIVTTSTGDNQAMLWNAVTGEKRFTFPGTENGIVLFGAWSPSGRYFALRGLGAHIYDAVTGAKVSEMVRENTMVTRVRWSPDERYIISTSRDDGAARLWDVTTGRELAALTGLTQAWGVAWSPDGRLAAIGGTDGSIRIWNPFQDEEVETIRGITSDPYYVFWTPDNRIFANDLLSMDGFNITSAEMTIPGLFGDSTEVAWSPDGKYISRGYRDGNFKVRELETGREVFIFDSGSGAPSSIGWSPSGDRIATLNGNGTLRIWEASSGELILETTDEYINGMNLAWSPDGNKLATTSLWSGSIYIWDAQTGEKLGSYSPHGNSAGIIEWSPDGKRIASTSTNGSAYIWDPETGDILLSLFPEDFLYWVTGVAWSHDGTRLAIASEDNFGRIFDTTTGDELLKFCCQEGAAWFISWTPADERILTASADGTVKVWDSTTGAELAVYNVGGFTSGAFSPDGTKILIATTDGTLRVYTHWATTEELIAYAKECCILRELTPEEREQFGLETIEGQ